MRISNMREKLEELQKELGDIEVMMPNIRDACFDEIEKMVPAVGIGGTQKEPFLMLIPGKDYVKMNGPVSLISKP